MKKLQQKENKQKKNSLKKKRKQLRALFLCNNNERLKN